MQILFSDIIEGFTWASYYLLICFILPYFFYSRVIEVMRCYWFYKHQQSKGYKLVFEGTPWPVLGHLPHLKKYIDELDRTKENMTPMVKYANSFNGEQFYGCLMLWLAHTPIIMISDVNIMEELYTTKNLVFDKHPLVKDLTLNLTGQSILFDETTPAWRERRKAMRPAFYQGKLQALTTIAAQAVKSSTQNLMKRIEENSGTLKINIIEEFSHLTGKVLLSCALGKDVSNKIVDYWEDGKLTQRPLQYCMRMTFQAMIYRMQSPHVCFFPRLANVYITPWERDVLANGIIIRKVFAQLVKERRNNLEKENEKFDLLSILLEDPIFADNDEKIIDELLTIFFAGSQTSANSSQNLILHLLKNPEYEQKILQELQDLIIDPALSQNTSQSSKTFSKDICDLYDYDSLQDLEFFTACFNESIRMQPPVYYSSTVRMSEPVDTQAGLRLRQGDMITVSICHLCKNDKEWQVPNEFRPERFDPKHPLYLTPEGKKRNSFSFSPFLGGARICLGKTFVESVSKVMVPSYLQKFKFEHLNEEEAQKPLPWNNMLCTYEPSVYLNVTLRDNNGLTS